MVQGILRYPAEQVREIFRAIDSEDLERLEAIEGLGDADFNFDRTTVLGFPLEIPGLSHSLNAFSNTPLCFAALTGKVRALEWLLSHGASPNYRAQNGITGMHSLAMSELTDKMRLSMAAQLLLEKGGEVDVLDAQKVTPLELSLIHQHRVAAVVLLEKGARLKSDPHIFLETL